MIKLAGTVVLATGLEIEIPRQAPLALVPVEEAVLLPPLHDVGARGLLGLLLSLLDPLLPPGDAGAVADGVELSRLGAGVLREAHQAAGADPGARDGTVQAVEEHHVIPRERERLWRGKIPRSYESILITRWAH